MRGTARTVALTAFAVIALGVSPASAQAPEHATDATPVLLGRTVSDPVVMTARATESAVESAGLIIARGEDAGTVPLLDRSLLRRSRTLDAGSPISFASAMPPLIASFDGISNTQNVDRASPPSMNGDVSSSQYVQAVSKSYAVYTKTGARIYGPVRTNTLFSGFGGPCETRNDGSPIVHYDQLAGRWLITQTAAAGAGAGYWQCMAVSTSADARGSYYRYAFQLSADTEHYGARFGVWPDGYYASFNNTSGTTVVVAFEREKMVLGQPAQAVRFDLSWPFSGLLPSDLDAMTLPPQGAPNAFAQVDDDVRGYPQDQLEIWNFHVDWASPASSSFTLDGNLATVRFDANVGNIPQPSHSVGLDANADRLMYRLAYRNFGTHEAMVVNHTVVSSCDGMTCQAGIRWYELRRTGQSWFLSQFGTHASADTKSYFTGSVALDNAGNMALGMSASSNSVRPSIYYAGRRPGDPVGWLMMESVMHAGSGSQTAVWPWWGEYSSMALDPTDGCTFWYTNEYFASSSSDGWKTRIGAFRYPTCKAGSPPVITSLAPTTGPVGTSVTVSGSGFTGASSVKFNGVSSQFSVGSSTKITAKVPLGASTGRVTVTTPVGTAMSPETFTVTGGGGGSVTVSSLAPASGPVGTMVTLLGTGFAGATSVTFNGVAAPFLVNSSTKITTRVPSGATTGPVSVKSPAGTGTSSSGFVVTSPGGGGEPTIQTFAPASGPIGTLVTLTGTGFTGATSVRFGGASAQFFVASSTKIVARVWAGAMTGPITVTTPLGTATSSTSFTLT